MDSEINQKKISFLALGDSYTIGEKVLEEERWPNQLISLVEGNIDELSFGPVEIIATTGWTTDELKEGIEKINPSKSNYDFVSLLIGVNNQYRGGAITVYEKEFEKLLEQAISYCKSRENVFVLSIPDYGVTPFGKDKNPTKIADEIAAFNEVNKQIAEKYTITYFDVTKISKKAANDRSYVAEDGLHPAGKMYAEWSALVSIWMKNQINK